MNLDKFILKSYLNNMAKRIIILSSLLLFFGVSFARTDPELSYDEAKKICAEIPTGIYYEHDAEFESNCNFIQFNHFQGRRLETSWNLTWSSLQVFDQILWLLLEMYRSSKNKENTLNQFQEILLSCEQTWKTESIKKVCWAMLDEWIGRKIRKSKITLGELFKVLQQEKEIKYRLDTETWEHFVPLDHWQVSPSESSIGDFLFWQVHDWNWNGKINYHQLWILKLGDTHWQPFVSFTLPPQLQDQKNYQEAFFFWGIAFSNHKLQYFLPIPMNQTHHYLVPQYELQKEGTWKLKKCWKWRDDTCGSYQDCKLKKKQLPLKQCENLWIMLTTTLSK